MASHKQIKVYDGENPNGTPIGIVRVKEMATYNLVRKEIVEDEIFEEPFNFVLEDNVEINAKQEGKWMVDFDKVHIKRKAIVHDLNSTGSKLPCINPSSSRIEEESNPMMETPTQRDTCVPNDVMEGWHKECNRIRAKLKTMVVPRDDNFEIRIEEVDGKGVVQLWCNECGEAYGSGTYGAKVSAYTCLSNYFRTHILSKRHEQRYMSKRGLSTTITKEEVTKEDDASCIHHALETLARFNEETSGASFEVVTGTLHDYKDKKLVRVRCAHDNTWFPLCPARSDLITIIKEHNLSKAHIKAIGKEDASSLPARSGARGRPTKSGGKDAKQQSLSKFLVSTLAAKSNVSLNEE